MKSWTLIVALSSRAFSAGNAANFFLLAQFLQTAQGYGPLAAGLRLLPWTACLFVVAPISGFLVNRVGERPLIVGGLLLQAVGLAWIGLIARPDFAYAGLVVPLIIAGLVLPGQRVRAIVQTQAKAPEIRENELYGAPEQSSSL